ncbi:MAG TPA: tetratricopeptide repeat protein [Chitinophagaceae bacterium]|nr:tetratricopeptide repeat protein [Chitinophagaceae bacterium]
MKKTLFIPLLLVVLSTFSQDIDNIEDLLYYKKFETAENLLQQILKNHAENAEAWYLLSEAQNSDSKPDSKSTLPDAPDHVKQDPYYLIAAGKILLNESKIQEAEKYFEQALQKTKYKKPELLLAVAKAKIASDQGDANQAIELLNKALKKDKRNPELYTELGKAYRKLNNGTEAFKAFRQAIEADKNFAEAYYLTGMIFRTKNNSDVYLDYFNKAIQADAKYAPAYYQLYYHYYFRDVNTAKQHLEKYIALSDHRIGNDYDHADILYLTKNYKQAIELAKKLIETDKEKTPARIYKLIAYSYRESDDQENAFDYIHRYFAAAPDSILIAKDFILVADLYAEKQKIDSAMFFYKVGTELETDSNSLVKYYKTLADLAKQQKDYTERASWLGKYYVLNQKSTNIDLFNWGLAWFQAGNYEKADSVFALYVDKYPTQVFGYYWRGRSSAAIDSTMEQGLAIPHYLKVVGIGELDTTGNSKRQLIESYGYLAGYEANQNKNYVKAIEYFEKLLQLDPYNEQAKKYVQILKETMAKKETLTDS